MLARSTPTEPMSDHLELRDPWLLCVRILWVIVTALCLTSWLADIPARYVQLQTICTGTVCGPQQPTTASIALFQASGLSLRFYSIYIGTLEVVYVAIHVVLALILFWRKSRNRMALLTSFLLITAGVSLGSAPDALAAMAPFWAAVVYLLQPLSLALLARFLLTFPDGRFVPRWMGWSSLVWIILIFVSTVIIPNDFSTLLLFGVLLFAALSTQVYRYRRISTHLQRQQARWAAFGTILAFGGFCAMLVVASAIGDAPGSISFLFGDTTIYLFLSLLPLSIAIAILRARLWDIDVLINRTLVYATLTATLALIYSGLVLGLQFFMARLTGQNGQHPAIIVLSTLAIAVLFQPLRVRIQTLIDRRFYRKKYDAAKTLASLSATLHQEVNLEQLHTHLLGVIEETMQPAHISLWLCPPVRPRLIEEPQTLEPVLQKAGVR